jgi:hypothetical protein
MPWFHAVRKDADTTRATEKQPRAGSQVVNSGTLKAFSSAP